MSAEQFARDTGHMHKMIDQHETKERSTMEPVA